MMDTDRGSGRTHRQIASMRTGDVLIVGSVKEMKHAQELAQKIGVWPILVWVTPDPYKLKGLRPGIHIFVDHDYKASDQMKQFIYTHNSMVPR